MERRSAENVALFDEVKQDLGYGLLLKKYTENIAEATEEQIKLAAAEPPSLMYLVSSGHSA